MKQIKFTATCLALACFSFMPSDDCSRYAPAKQGMELTYKQFNAKDKPEGSTRTTVLAVKDGGSTIEVQNEAFDKKDKSLGAARYELRCEGGTYYLDMENLVTAEQKNSFKNMNVKVEADKLDIPANPSAGQKLKDGTLKMNGSTEGSPIGMSLTINITNRQVAAVEDIVVPAGTYKAVKITYDVESKMVFTIRSKVAEWYVKDLGIVRNETYDKNGKLLGYMVLDKIKE